mmetsp:Transcript_7837/g.7320  ORF Transcript_7837/g.7320 Transcript_7837/m.7320 type:complete len:269 (-) Transcript_7837:52-858(-)
MEAAGPSHEDLGLIGAWGVSVRALKRLSQVGLAGVLLVAVVLEDEVAGDAEAGEELAVAHERLLGLVCLDRVLRPIRHQLEEEGVRVCDDLAGRVPGAGGEAPADVVLVAVDDAEGRPLVVHFVVERLRSKPIRAPPVNQLRKHILASPNPLYELVFLGLFGEQVGVLAEGAGGLLDVLGRVLPRRVALAWGRRVVLLLGRCLVVLLLGSCLVVLLRRIPSVLLLKGFEGAGEVFEEVGDQAFAHLEAFEHQLTVHRVVLFLHLLQEL